MALVELFGEKLLTKEGEHDTVAVLKGKSQVMVFFSARWSPISRQYTQALSEAYERAAKECDKTAIIFVSSDRDQAAFDEYRVSMPFHSLPYSARDIKDALFTKFVVKDIPALVLLDGEGYLMEGDIFGKHDEFLFDGRPDEASNAEREGNTTAGLDGFYTVGSATEVAPTSSLHSSPSGAAAFVELFGEKLLTKEGEQDTSKVLAGKVHVLLVFSAQWSKQNQDFMPHVSAIYERALANQKTIIYVSLDCDQKAFDENWGPLPFPAIPYAARDKQKQLCHQCGIKDLPSFACFDRHGRETKGVFTNNIPSADALTCADAAQACTDCCIA